MHIISFFFHFLSLLFIPSFPLPPQMCAQTMKKLIAGHHVTKEDLVLLGQLPNRRHDQRQFYSLLRSILLPMKRDPVVTLLALQKSHQQEVSLEELFERAEVEDSAEVWSSIQRSDFMSRNNGVVQKWMTHCLCADSHSSSSPSFLLYMYAHLVHSQLTLWCAVCSDQTYLP